MRKGNANSFGVTRSVKGIMMTLDDEMDSLLCESDDVFSFEDHFDAFCVFEYLALREKRKMGENELCWNYETQANFHLQLLQQSGVFESCALNAGITNAFTVRDHGRSLVHVEYRDF